MVDEKNHKTIAVVGLGYVGLPLAVAFGNFRPVLGFDINHKRIEQLKNGVDQTLEVANSELLAAKHLRFSAEGDDLACASIFIVTVPTPIDKANRPNLGPLLGASETIGRVLKKGDIVIYESTVFPGCTEEMCVPVLEALSGLKYNVDFFCGYSPKRINPGDKANKLPNIKKITSGSTPAIAQEIDELYSQIIVAGTHKASSIKVAEAAKVIENSQRDLNIAFVNELSVIFERMEIDTLEVLEAAGSKWNFLPFRPGMVGGHCIGVDPYYLTHKAEELGYHPQVILAGRRINDNVARYAARSIVRRMLQVGHNVPNSKIGVFGITFKENCPDVRNSKVADMIKELETWNVSVVVHDPWADPEEVKHEYGITLVSQAEMNGLNAAIVAVAHDEFRDSFLQTIVSLCSFLPKPILGDLKSIYDMETAKSRGFTLFRL